MAYSTTILADSPVRYYRLGDAVNSLTATDSSTSAQTGTVSSSTHVVFGQTGALNGDSDTAVNFDGAGYISVPQTGLPTGNAAFTLEGWFKTTKTGAFQFIVCMGANVTHESGQLYLNSSNQLVGDLNNNRITSSGTYTNGAWHYAVFTWDGTTAILYCDNVQVASSSTIGPNNLTQSVAGSIGNQQSFGGNFFTGTIDEVAIYATALSPSTIAAHYLAGAGPGTAALSFGALEALTIPTGTPAALSSAYVEAVTTPTVVPAALSNAYVEAITIPPLTPAALSGLYIEVLTQTSPPPFEGWGVSI